MSNMMSSAALKRSLSSVGGSGAAVNAATDAHINNINTSTRTTPPPPPAAPPGTGTDSSADNTSDMDGKHGNAMNDTMNGTTGGPIYNGPNDTERTNRIIRLTRVTPRHTEREGGIQREARLITRLAITLTSYLGTSTRWMIMCARLMLFVVLLFPAFLRMIYWFTRAVRNGSVLRSIRYGRNARNLLDIYRPITKGDDQTKVPVVVFVSGGAWTIGYKGWGALMGRVIMQHGIMFVTPDYRNFPQGNMSRMVEDIDHALGWVFANIDAYGGDPSRIYLVGQSAGAHLTCLTLLNQVRRAYDAIHTPPPTPLPPSIPRSTSTDSDSDDDNDTTKGGTNPDGVFPPPPSLKRLPSFTSQPSLSSLTTSLRWQPRDLRGYIGISGPYDLVTFIDVLEKRGLNRRLFTSIVGADEKSLSLYSPLRILHDLRVSSQSPSSLTPSSMDTNTELFYAQPEVVKQFPPILLYHGTKDASVPVSSSQLLHKSLRECGIPCTLTCYAGKSHTDPILEDPMGGHDPLLTDLVGVISGHATNTKQTCHRLVNPYAIAVARYVNPF